MDFSRMSDGIRLGHASHRHDGYDGDDEAGPAPGAPFVTEAVGGGDLVLVPVRLQVKSADSGARQRARIPSSIIPTRFNPNIPHRGRHGRPVGNHAAAGLDVSSTTPASGASHSGMGIATVESGANAAGNSGDGCFYGSTFTRP